MSRTKNSPKKSQMHIVLERLTANKSITVNQARSKYSIKNLSARISDLRNTFSLPIRNSKIRVKGVTKKVNAYRLDESGIKRAQNLLSTFCNR